MRHDAVDITLILFIAVPYNLCVGRLSMPSNIVPPSHPVISSCVIDLHVSVIVVVDVLIEHVIM